MGHTIYLVQFFFYEHMFPRKKFCTFLIFLLHFVCVHIAARPCRVWELFFLQVFCCLAF